MIDSDDFRIPEAGERAKQIFRNDAVNRLAADGISFRPVEGNTGEQAADIFVRRDSENVYYVALFNFTTEPKTMNVSLERTGLNPSGTWRVQNLISGQQEASVTTGSMRVEMAGAEPKLYRFSR